MSSASVPLESLHPSLWRGSQLARGGARTVGTGYPALSAELPGGGWPVGALVELLVPHAGCGEMRLLAPGLAGTVAERRPLALVAPPHPPHAAALAALGVPLDALLWLRTGNRRDALWTAEQTLKAGCCGALLFWQMEAAPADVLRRLHLAAARAGDTLAILGAWRPSTSQSTFAAETEIYDQSDDLIATGAGTFRYLKGERTDGVLTFLD